MSAIEWLQSISFWCIVVTIAVLLASIPFNAKRHSTLPVKPLSCKKSQWILLAIIIIGWLLADWSTHIMIPIIRVNMVLLSQLLLVPTLIASSIITLKRLSERNNVLAQCFVLMFRYAPCILKPLAKILAVFGLICIDALSSQSNKSSKEPGLDRACTDSEELMLKSGVNYHGGYSDKYKSTFYDDN